MQMTVKISKWSNSFLSIGPLAKALLLAVCATLFIQLVSQDTAYNSSAIYSGIFNILAIFSGFLSTFYVFIATRSNKFLEAIRETITFKSMLGLMQFTIVWTLGIVFITYLLTILDPKSIEFGSTTQVVVLLWCWNVFLIIVNFVRCVQMFFSIIEKT